MKERMKVIKARRRRKEQRQKAAVKEARLLREGNRVVRKKKVLFS